MDLADAVPDLRRASQVWGAYGAANTAFRRFGMEILALISRAEQGWTSPTVREIHVQTRGRICRAGSKGSKQYSTMR